MSQPPIWVRPVAIIAALFGLLTIYSGGMALFGGVDIVVPEDLDVEVSGAGIFGGFDGKNHKGSSDLKTPKVKVNGVAIFGGVDVKIKRR